MILPSEYLNNENNELMPLLFLGHGSPMNAIEENDYVTGFREMAKTIPRPKAILCISAHWETPGTQITAMKKPKTIHDFGGFPRELYAVEYPAPGSPELALETKNLIKKAEAELDQTWGLDHGAWSVLKHFYPQANIPIIEMSLDYYQKPEYHYALAKEIASLRNKGVLVVGSGNIVHNLRLIDWKNIQINHYGFDWAIEANEKMKSYIRSDNHTDLIHYGNKGKAFELAIPSPEHYLPLLYVLALKQKNEEVAFFNDALTAGSISMTSLKIS